MYSVNDDSLTLVLSYLGYAHYKAANNSRDIVCQKTGDWVGRMKCDECWEWLRKTGQISE
jgi:hypothetical protein